MECYVILITLDDDYKKCAICDRVFVKNESDTCLDCFLEGRPHLGLREATHLYQFGTHLECLKTILKGEALEEFEKGISKMNKKEKIRHARECYHARFGGKRGTGSYEGYKDIYKDECPHCHHPYYWSRSLAQRITCKKCGRFLVRERHPSEELLEKMKEIRRKREDVEEFYANF